MARQFKGTLVDEDIVETMNKGDYMPYSRKNGTRGIIYCCPICGEASAGTDKHRYSDGGNVSPSIIHKCGFHCKLVNGVFIEY